MAIALDRLQGEKGNSEDGAYYGEIIPTFETIRIIDDGEAKFELWIAKNIVGATTQRIQSVS